MPDTSASFGYLVRRRRKALDYTQEELARLVGCSPATIRKIENDERRPSKQVAELLAQTLEVPELERKNFIHAARAERGVSTLQIPQEPVSETPPRGNSLPQPVTPFIGRELELYQLLQLMLGSDSRLVTLLGPSGIGKTRLAIEAGLKVKHRDFPIFKDGIYFVPLEQVQTGQFIVHSIAEKMGLSFSGTGAPQQQLLQYLSGKRLLLILDNLEHLLAYTDLVSEILHHAAGVKVLTTSSERLNLQGEWVVEIQGLPVPSPGPGEDLTESSAVQLFLQSAQRLQEDFVITPQNQASIGEICRLLEGMPLGIELAASWVRALPVEMIAQEIQTNLDFLNTSSRDLPERQRSMRAVFEHAWRLLTPQEQQVMRRFSVFSGGFDRQAAGKVCEANLPVLAHLMEKSLLRRTEDERFHIHELVRQFAQAELEQDEDAYCATRSQHSQYYLRLLAESVPGLLSEGQNRTLALLRDEINNNIRSAWEWAIQQVNFDIIAETSFAMVILHEFSNTNAEGASLFTRTLDAFEHSAFRNICSEAHYHLIWGNLMARKAWMIARLGHIHESLQLMEKAIQMIRICGDQKELATALYHSAIMNWFSGKYSNAKQDGTEALASLEQLHCDWQLATLHCVMGGIEYEQGNFADAHRLLNEGLTLCRKIGNPRAIVGAINWLCHTLTMFDQYEEMQSLLQEAQTLTSGNCDNYSRAMLLEQLCVLYEKKGEFDQARSALEECCAIHRENGDVWSLSRMLNQAAQFFERQGQEHTAFDLYTESHHIARENQITRYALDAEISLAALSDRINYLTSSDHSA